MRSSKTGPSRRRKDVWALWRRHLEAQRASGQTQLSYCREQVLEPQYFSVWKRKLADADNKASQVGADATLPLAPLQLVPVVLERSCARDSTSVDALLIHLKLPNGLAVSIEVSAMDALPPVLAQLARVSC